MLTPLHLARRETKLSRSFTTAASEAINNGFSEWTRYATAAAMDSLAQHADSGDLNPEEWDQWDRQSPSGVQSAGVQVEFKRLVSAMSVGFRKALIALKLKVSMKFLNAFIDWSVLVHRC